MITITFDKSVYSNCSKISLDSNRKVIQLLFIDGSLKDVDVSAFDEISGSKDKADNYSLTFTSKAVQEQTDRPHVEPVSHAEHHQSVLKTVEDKMKEVVHKRGTK